MLDGCSSRGQVIPAICFTRHPQGSEAESENWKGDSIRLQIPLINPVSSTRLVHANELPKRISACVLAENENKVCIKEMRLRLKKKRTD
ncbi:hypothetical protein NQZ68_039543 [Dissostichus eleginoides]|nr:hypothetical protein NQZ68_039543 [Dissostichus eleginoides]